MMIIPAIDLMNGKVVRLTQGDVSRRIEYPIKPQVAVDRWVREGAEMIHIVDLDAAFGIGNNRSIIKVIASECSIPLQVGGGIRDVATASDLLESGLYRIILGSLAFNNPQMVINLIKKYTSDRVVVSLDHKRGEIRINGWKTSAGIQLKEALSSLKPLEIEWVQITDVERDGTFAGPDIENIRTTSRSFRVIAGGGIASTGDIEELREAGASAAVIGKALYENRFTLSEAQEAAKC